MIANTQNKTITPPKVDDFHQGLLFPCTSI